jgi:hypothetical protein
MEYKSPSSKSPRKTLFSPKKQKPLLTLGGDFVLLPEQHQQILGWITQYAAHYGLSEVVTGNLF